MVFSLHFLRHIKMLDNELNRNEVQVMKRENMSQQLGMSSQMGGPFAEVSSTMAVPETPKGGVLVKVNTSFRLNDLRQLLLFYFIIFVLSTIATLFEMIIF